MDIDLGQFVPFVGHLHIASRATTGGASAHLADAEHLRNHLGRPLAAPRWSGIWATCWAGAAW